MPEEIITTAQNHLGDDRIQVDAMIAEMEQTIQALQAEKEEARKAREEQQRLKNQREHEVKKIREAKFEILKKAKDEADSMLAKARDDIASITKGLHARSQQRRSVIDDEARKAREALMKWWRTLRR